jgi:hypothetical protein
MILTSIPSTAGRKALIQRRTLPAVACAAPAKPTDPSGTGSRGSPHNTTGPRRPPLRTSSRRLWTAVRITALGAHEVRLKALPTSPRPASIHLAQRDNLYQPGAIAPGQPQQHHPAACRDALYHQTSQPKALDCGSLLPLSRSQPAGPAPFKPTRLRSSAPQALDRCQNYSSPSRTECARPAALPTRQSSEHARDREALYSRHPTSPLRTSSRRLGLLSELHSPSHTECAYQPLPTRPGHAEVPLGPLHTKPHISVHTGPSLLPIHPIGPIRPIRPIHPIPPSAGVIFSPFKRLPARQPRPTSAARRPEPQRHRPTHPLAATHPLFSVSANAVMASRILPSSSMVE